MKEQKAEGFAFEWTSYIPFERLSNLSKFLGLYRYIPPCRRCLTVVRARMESVSLNHHSVLHTLTHGMLVVVGVPYSFSSTRTGDGKILYNEEWVIRLNGNVACILLELPVYLANNLIKKTRLLEDRSYQNRESRRERKIRTKATYNIVFNCTEE